MDDYITPIIEKVEERLSKLGLYLNSFDIGLLPSNPEEKIDESNILEKLQSGELKLFFNTNFRTSDIAWSDRVLEPEVFEEKMMFQKIAPTEFEVELQSFKDELEEWD